MSDSKKVLLIAPYFIPRRRVGALRPFKFAIHLSSLGYKPVVLTIGHQPDQLTSKERKMLQSIEILSIESPFDRTSTSDRKSASDQASASERASTLGRVSVSDHLSTSGRISTSDRTSVLDQTSVSGHSSPSDRTSMSDHTSTPDRTSASSRISTPQNGEKHSKKKKQFGDKILSWIDRHCPIDTWIFLFLLRWGWIKRVTVASKPDLIMATGDPWSGLWLGQKLSKRLKVPFIADFRDPWTLGNQRLRARSSFSNGVDRVIEKSVLDHADHVIFTSGQTQQLYSEEYQIPAEKISVIYNSFEPDLMSNSRSMNIPEMDPEKLNILFLGRFRRLSSPSVILDVLKEIKSSHPARLNQIRIHSFGEPDQEELEKIQRTGFSAQFLIHPPVEPELSLQVMNSADQLLLSTSRQRSEIIPAKLWDYLFSDAPILSIVPNPEVGEIIKKMDAGVHFEPENLKGISDCILGADQQKQSETDRILPNKKDSDGIMKYTSKAATEKLVAIFDGLLKRDQP
jgi:glycosyltransferase involved in cell wall biosynthesis